MSKVQLLNHDAKVLYQGDSIKITQLTFAVFRSAIDRNHPPPPPIQTVCQHFEKEISELKRKLRGFKVLLANKARPKSTAITCSLQYPKQLNTDSCFIIKCIGATLVPSAV